MAFRPGVHHRRSVRLPGRDYARAGAYFVTLCVAQKLCLLGDIVHSKFIPNENGRIAAEEWAALPQRFAEVRLGPWVVMPNHLHGIIELSPAGFAAATRGEGAQGAGVQPRAPTPAGRSGPRRPKTLGGIVGAFKGAVTAHVNQRDRTPRDSFWQRGFHEHIIRDAQEYRRIEAYILVNPRNWPDDPDTPAAPSMRNRPPSEDR